MAIVFTPVKKTQGKSFWIITIGLFFILALLSVAVFWLKFNSPKDIALQSALTGPDIRINFAVLEGDQIKSLDLFIQPKTQFGYTAQDAKGKKVSGTIMADSQDEAKAILVGMNLTPITVDEVLFGRSEPFSTFYK